MAREIRVSCVSLPPANEVCEGYVFTGVCLSTGGWHAWQGACMVEVGMHGGGACMAGGVHGGGACVSGGMHGRGACGRGACVGGMCGMGACMVGGVHGGGAFVADTTRYGQ